jgi:hypothetical protein
MAENKKLKCFVIMPFTVRQPDLHRYLNDRDHWQEVYEGLIRPAVERAGLVCERDDEDLSTRLIADHVWQKIERADIVLCDLSAANPNVLLELGWALRADKRFVLIKDDTTGFNFDINQFYTFTYGHQLQPRALRDAVSGLANVLKTTLQDDTKKYSLISKLSVSFSAIEAASKGDLEASLLNEILREVRKGRSYGSAAPGATERLGAGKLRAKIFWHTTSFVKEEAFTVMEALERASIQCEVLPHIDPNPPDAVFIGALVGAHEGRLALTAVPYEIKYIFRPDYPEKHGGDSTGLSIGIGYMSSHFIAGRSSQEEPIKVLPEQVKYLCESRQTNTEFQRRLREITGF